jgi:hypothetical protein
MLPAERERGKSIVNIEMREKRKREKIKKRDRERKRERERERGVVHCHLAGKILKYSDIFSADEQLLIIMQK